MEKTITISGGYGLTNFGDDLLMIGCYEYVLNYFNPDNIIILYWDKNYIGRFCKGVHTVKVSEASKVNTNYFLLGGGTQFYTFGLKAHLTISFYKELVLFFINHLIKRKNVLTHGAICSKVFLLGIGFGPFENKGFKYLKAGIAVKQATYVSVRDRYSQHFLDKSKRAYNIGADICYNTQFRKLFMVNKKNCNEIQKIAFIVRDWPYHDEEIIIDKVYHLYKDLTDKGYHVTFILFAPRSDLRWAGLLKKKCTEYLFWDPENSSVAEFVSQLSRFDLTITMRFHGAVISHLLTIPVVCVNIEQKLKLISEQIGTGAFCWDYASAFGTIYEFIDLMNQNRNLVAENMKSSVDKQRALADQMLQCLPIN